MTRPFLALVLAALLAAPAWAQSITDSLVTQLRAQGYDVLEMHDTWLGRVRVIAESDSIRREIVFNPGTGEILRDYAVDLIALAARQAEDARVRADDNSGATALSATDESVRGDADMQADSFILPEPIMTDPDN